MEVENGSLEDEFSLQRGHFPLPGLLEKEYINSFAQQGCGFHLTFKSGVLELFVGLRNYIPSVSRLCFLISWI